MANCLRPLTTPSPRICLPSRTPKLPPDQPPVSTLRLALGAPTIVSQRVSLASLPPDPEPPFKIDEKEDMKVLVIPTGAIKSQVKGGPGVKGSSKPVKGPSKPVTFKPVKGSSKPVKT
ncbi:unnamed protein product [Cyclocybe aegerita]|uniref:Uncharacterized protein n=1 Tax=Cyclocybe aegerita TaxID=1973307 RepID=A0A8S0X6P0_CYCAE|nr:unnamed protein product [Cyclocybe aegerita]